MENIVGSKSRNGFRHIFVFWETLLLIFSMGIKKKQKQNSYIILFETQQTPYQWDWLKILESCHGGKKNNMCISLVLNFFEQTLFYTIQQYKQTLLSILFLSLSFENLFNSMYVVDFAHDCKMNMNCFELLELCAVFWGKTMLP